MSAGGGSGGEPRIPRYAELRARRDAPPGSSWHVFGPDDDVGTINFLTPERIVAAARLVRRGAVFNLDYPLDAFPEPVTFRATPRHSINFIGISIDGTAGVSESPTTVLDDRLDDFYPQGSTQIDGLRHHLHHEYGFYGGVPAEQIKPGTPVLGVNRWAERGIVGRGVLIDVARQRASRGAPLNHRDAEPFGPGLLDETLAAQGTRLLGGDIVMIRTDYARHHRLLEAGDPQGYNQSGLEQTWATVEWLWDNHVALVASDNLMLEATQLNERTELGAGSDGRLHDQLLPLLGMPIGELWRLDDLGADSAEDGVYESLVVASPLNLIGGVGTPANAVAIK